MAALLPGVAGKISFEYTVRSTQIIRGEIMQTVTVSPTLELHNLSSDPAEEWSRLLGFVGLTAVDKHAMSHSTEILLRRAPELVINTYNYLLSVPETAAILGWERGANEEHLAERRRFFAVWLARVIGMDTSDEFAYYLVRAGKFHAGHGPRHIHTPPAYITTSIGIVGAAFASYMQEAGLSGSVIAKAMAGWNKYLSVQLHMMLLGYETARRFSQGAWAIPVKLFGRMRLMVGDTAVTVHVDPGSSVEDLLRKFFDYYPQTRSFALERVWNSEEKTNSAWVEVKPVYVPIQKGWRVLLNGRDLTYAGGFPTPLSPNDTISIFPPGR